MEALYEGLPFDTTGRSESVRNLYERYRTLGEYFPQDLRDQSLPYFIDWLLNNVPPVEIMAFSDDDAYTILETMNERGLSLNPTSMMKGYLLANINDDALLTVPRATAWRASLAAETWHSTSRSDLRRPFPAKSGSTRPDPSQTPPNDLCRHENVLAAAAAAAGSAEARRWAFGPVPDRPEHPNRGADSAANVRAAGINLSVSEPPPQ